MPFDVMSSTPIEIERKFLIRMPELAIIREQSDIKIRKIEQTYLCSDNNSSSRVRKIIENDTEYYTKTVKKRISPLSCYEEEFEIENSQYVNALKFADTSKATICKTRYAFPHANHIIEIDVYPFWNDRAILEIELTDENESFSIPDFIEVIKEVSTDVRYKNTNIANVVPIDEI